MAFFDVEVFTLSSGKIDLLTSLQKQPKEDTNFSYKQLST